MTGAVFVGDLTDLPDMGNTHHPGSADPHGKNLVSVFSHMDQYPGFQNVMIGPLSISYS